MAKIFVSLYNFAYHKKSDYIMPPFYETFLRGLKKEGNTILCFFDKTAAKFDKKIPKDVLFRIKKFDPDLFIFFNNTFWDISRYFDCPIIVYDVDTINFFRNKDKLAKKTDRYLYLTFQEESVDLIVDYLNVNRKHIKRVPLFTGITSDSNKKISTNIAFLGWNWMNVGFYPVTDFLEKNPTIEELNVAKYVYNSFLNNPFKSSDEIYSEKKYSFIENRLEINKLEELSSLISGILRARYLCAISDLGLDLRGMSWSDNSTKYFPDLCLCFNKKQVFSVRENSNFYNRARIGFNTNHIQAKSGFSWRVCDIMASNACLVSEFKPGIKQVFSKIPIPTFTTPFEAREQCTRILKEHNLRSDIVNMSHEIIEKNHRVDAVINRIENFVNIPLHNRQKGKLTFWYYRDFEIRNFENCELNIKSVKKLNLRNYIRYRVWKRLDSILKRKGII